jgi:hypothetical protein
MSSLYNANLSTQNGPVVKRFAQLFLKIELLYYSSEWAFELNIFLLVESFPAILSVARMFTLYDIIFP